MWDQTEQFQMLTSVDLSTDPPISSACVISPLEFDSVFPQHFSSTYNVLTSLVVAFMKKKIKLEFFDRAGVRHSVAIEGDFTVDKVNRLLEYAEIVAGSNARSSAPIGAQDTKMSRLLDVINTRLASRSFDSRDLWQAYRENWDDEFSLGAVSTYLSRLVDRGTLEREGSPAHWSYRLKPSPMLPQ